MTDMRTDDGRDQDDIDLALVAMRRAARVAWERAVRLGSEPVVRKSHDGKSYESDQPSEPAGNSGSPV